MLCVSNLTHVCMHMCLFVYRHVHVRVWRLHLIGCDKEVSCNVIQVTKDVLRISEAV